MAKSEFISTVEAAQVIGVHRCTVSEMIRDGRLKCVDVAQNCKRIRTEDARAMRRQRMRLGLLKDVFNRFSAAEYAGVTTRQIDRWRASGLASTTDGRNVSIKKSDLDRYMKSLSSAATTDAAHEAQP